MYAQSTYLMRDQVRNRVGTIMACDLRHPDLRPRQSLTPMMLVTGIIALNLLATVFAV